MWFIGVGVEQETSASPPKKNPGSAPVKSSIVSLETNRKRLQRLLGLLQGTGEKLSSSWQARPQ